MDMKLTQVGHNDLNYFCVGTNTQMHVCMQYEGPRTIYAGSIPNQSKLPK